MTIWENLGPINDLLTEGHRLRAEQRDDEAMELYFRAWEIAEELDDDALRVAASHMIAVVEPKDVKKLEWNLVSLEHARALDEATAAQCYPTVHANIGWSLLALGNRDDAREHYEIAREYATGLDGEYGDSIRAGIERMLDALSV